MTLFFKNIEGDLSSEGILLARDGPILVKNELNPLAIFFLSVETALLIKNREQEEEAYFSIDNFL